MIDHRMRVTHLMYPALWSGALLLAGCTQKHRAAAPESPTITTPADASAEVANRVRDLSRESEDFDVLSHQLPGNNTQEHRLLMVKVFSQLGQILPLLHGSTRSLVFRQQLLIIDTSRAQLATAPADMVIEPTVDTGLRATYNALLGISRHPSLDAVALDAPLTQLKTKLDELDSTRGLTHQVVAGEAVELTSGVITKMADMFTAQLAPDSSTQPSTEPASTDRPTTEPAGGAVPDSITPSTAPATGPTSGPTTPPGPEVPSSSPTTAPDAATEPAAAPASEPAASPATEPAAAPASEPAATAPATDPAPAPDLNK